jgi:hypothetical protein
MPSKKTSKNKKSSSSNDDEDRANEILATAFENDPERAQALMDVAKKTARDAGLPMQQVMKMIQQSILEREKEDERSRLTEHERRKLEKKDRKAESTFHDSKVCDACGQTKVKLNYCSKCKCRLYCNETCQLAHWKSSHKRECKYLRTLRDVPQIPREYSQQFEWHWVVGTIRTQHHGNFFVVMDQAEARTEQHVPLAYVKLDDEQQGHPTPRNVAECLYNAMWFPEFDTTVGGWRRPYYVRIIEGSNDDGLCMLLTRVQMVIQSRAVQHDSMKQWFCLQMGWTDEVGDNAPSVSRLERNGMARKDLKDQLNIWNELAVKEQKPRHEFPTREEILKLPVESDETPRLSLDNSISVAMHEGFLYIFRRDDILCRERLVVDAKSSCRPDVDDVVARLCAVIKKLGERPAAISLGNPSVCSHTDVHLYEQALDESIVRDHCSLSLFGNIESNLVDYYLPLWRQTNRIK